MKALTFLKTITILNVLISTGFAVAAILNPVLILPAHTPAEKATTILALYAGARTIPIAALSIISVFRKHQDAFITLAILTGTMQLLDGFIGIYEHEVSKAAGPFFIAMIQFAAIYLAVRNND
jgi:hypothetical protein